MGLLFRDNIALTEVRHYMYDPLYSEEYEYLRFACDKRCCEFITVRHCARRSLQKLGLFATFSINNQFEEEIKMRGFEPMQYNQLSEGEKLRFDMAVMLAWRDMARLKSNMSCNLLIMDEVFDSSLDQEGVTAFADLLKLLGGLNVFVITHTPEKLADSFRSFIRFQRVEGFTTLAPVSGF